MRVGNRQKGIFDSKYRAVDMRVMWVMRASYRYPSVILIVIMLSFLTEALSQNIDGSSMLFRSSASSPAPTEIAYRLAEPEMKSIDDPSGRYLRMTFPGHHQTHETGKPELPVWSRLIEVPDGMEVAVTLSGVVSRRVHFADHGVAGAELIPVQPARTKNQSPDSRVTFKDRSSYMSRSTLRHDTVTITHEGTFRGRRIANISVYPAFYNPAGRYVDLITAMTIGITYTPSATKGTGEEADPSNKGGSLSDLYMTGYANAPVQMIIVTDTLFAGTLEPLERWKRLKGIESTVIYRRPGPVDTVYHDLKRRITERYFSLLEEGKPVQYLLIAGDPAVIPTARVTSNVSDLYYGEFDGDGDYIPELFIGRLPAADTTQLRGMIKKIVDYETYRHGPDNSFWKTALVTAGNAPGFELYMNGHVSYIHSNYLLADTSISAVGWLYPESVQKDVRLREAFNKGLSLLNYTGHGEATGFSDPVLKTSTMGELNNEHSYPLIISNACRTAQINVAACFGTAMVAAPTKGAIGFIGCTNDSYWNDDFFWAVGPGTPGLNVTYENTGAGAFDRLFHTHGEAPGEWYHTMGQINFSGNMSVSASTSPRKKYYWETYILLGDPSLSPMIGRPDTFRIELPDRVPRELTTLSFTAEPFAYAALSDFNTLWDARHVSPTGNIELTIPEGAKDSCLLVVTGQNMIPLFKTIRFGNVSEPFITVTNIAFDDSDGNGNGVPDFGETLTLRVTVKNLGKSTSGHLTAQLTVASGPVVAETDPVTIGSLLPGKAHTINEGFTFTVPGNISDGELASLLLLLSDGTDEYRFGIDMTLHAPDLRILSALHDDALLGNGNFLPDPGESLHLSITIKNEGSSAADGTVTVNPGGPLLILPEREVATGMVEPGEEKRILVAAEISPLAPPGTVIPYEVTYRSGSYETRGRWSLSTGKTRETWEFGRFDIFPWIQDSNNPWYITSSTAYENRHSVRSAQIGDRTSSVLAVWVNNPVADTISFYVRVSSEPNYDKLIFRIDSVSDLELSGDIPWAQRKRLLSPGVHLLEWIYSKDVSLSGGLDGAWLDQVTFPDIAFLEADLHVDVVYPPSTGIPLNDFTVMGRIINYGRTALTSFPLAYTVNDGEMVNETFYRKIEPGDTVDVAFTERCNLQKDISYTISIISRLPEDEYPANDTATVSFVISSTGAEIADGMITAHPNPFSGNLAVEIDFEGSTTAVIELIDIHGRVVLQTTAALLPGRNHIPLEGEHLPAGIYNLRISSRGNATIIKVIKR